MLTALKRHHVKMLKRKCQSLEELSVWQELLTYMLTLVNAFQKTKFNLENANIRLLFYRGFHTVNIKIAIVLYQMFSFLKGSNSLDAFSFIFRLVYGWNYLQVL